MSATLGGKIAVYGIDGTLAYTGMAKTVNILKGFTLSESAREAELDKNGHIIGGARDNVRRQISVSFIPYDPSNTSSLATAKSNVVLPPQLGQITIADWGITALNGTYTAKGTWTVSTREDGYLEISGTAENYLQADGTYKDLATIATS